MELAFDGLGNTRVARVRCIDSDRQEIATVAGAVVKALVGKPAGEPEVNARLGERLSAAFHLARRKAQRRGERLVLMLDDADFCISAFTEPGTPEQERLDAREFWTTLAEQCGTGGCAVVVASLSGSLLASTVIDGWADPLANQVRVLRIEPLELGDIRRLCTELGRQINVSFSSWALRHISALSAGNVAVVHSLCSTVVRLLRQAGGVSPLQHLRVGRADIQCAAEQLVHTGDAFRSHLLPWLGPVERKLMEPWRASVPVPPRSSGTCWRTSIRQSSAIRPSHGCGTWGSSTTAKGASPSPSRCSPCGCATTSSPRRERPRGAGIGSSTSSRSE